jgi:hypothetical protein
VTGNQANVNHGTSSTPLRGPRRRGANRFQRRGRSAVRSGIWRAAGPEADGVRDADGIDATSDFSTGAVGRPRRPQRRRQPELHARALGPRGTRGRACPLRAARALVGFSSASHTRRHRRTGGLGRHRPVPRLAPVVRGPEARRVRPARLLRGRKRPASPSHHAGLRTAPLPVPITSPARPRPSHSRSLVKLADAPSGATTSRPRRDRCLRTCASQLSLSLWRILGLCES